MEAERAGFASIGCSCLDGLWRGLLLAGLMAVHWSRLIFEDGTATNFQEEIADPIWQFCSRGIDVRATLGGLLPGVNILARHYQRHIVGKATPPGFAGSP